MSHPKISKQNPVSILLNDFGDNGLMFEVYFWANRGWEMEFIKSDIRFAIEEEFRKSGVRIPFPQRDLHIVSKNSDESLL